MPGRGTGRDHRHQQPPRQRQPAVHLQADRRAGHPGLHRQPFRAAPGGGPGPVGQPRRLGAGAHLPGHPHGAVPGQDGNLPTPPRTIAEVVTTRTSEDTIAQRLIDAAVTLTLIVAGCSLAVAVGGGLVDRKRPFTLLRVSGVPAGALSRVVLMEAALPLAAATLIAAGIAYGTSVLAVSRLGAEGVAIPSPGRVYYEILGAGLVLALFIILLTVPLQRRMSAPGNVRFE